MRTCDFIISHLLVDKATNKRCFLVMNLNICVIQGAENFWTIPEYGEILFWGDKSLEDYEKELETLHSIPKPDIYRYPRCRQFKQVHVSLEHNHSESLRCLFL